MANRVRDVIESGGMALGGLTGNFTGPTLIELIGIAGLDAAVIDLEHNGLDLADVRTMVLACEVAGITSIVRLPSIDSGLITRLLDVGTQCIQVDGIESADEARALVDAVRFPPLGSRGLIWNSRAARYGRVARGAWRAEANADVLVKTSLDSIAGVEAAEDVASVPGVDIIGIGAHDLANVLGAVGKPDDPALNEAIGRVIHAVTGAGRSLALPLGSSAWPRDAAQLRALGTGYTNLQPHPEERLLTSLGKQVDEVRSALEASAPAR